MKSRNLITKKNQKGQAALLIVLITMTSLLFVGLVLTNITIKRAKITREISQSVQAYYLADAGTERLLYLIKGTGAIDPVDYDAGDPTNNEFFDEDIDFDGNIDFNAVKTSNSPLEMKVTGYFKNTARAVELSW